MDPRPINSGEQGLGDGMTVDAKNTAGRMLEKAQEKARDLGRNTVSAIDGNREPLANTLSDAAASLHATGDSLHETGNKASAMAHDASEAAANIAHGAADRMQTGADFVRDNDLTDMMSSVKGFLKKNPGVALLAAGVVGFVAGRALRKD